jgi:hypothetical protein
MTPSDIHPDALLAALRELRTFDVSPARAQRLRARCQSRLKMEAGERQSLKDSEGSVWPRAVRILACAWCVVYLLETIRRAAAIYGF